MSYILDALKKAEAERNLSTPSSIHAPPTFAAVHGSAARRKRWLWPALCACTLLLAGLAWIGATPNNQPGTAPLMALAPEPTTPQPSAPPVVTQAPTPRLPQNLNASEASHTAQQKPVKPQAKAANKPPEKTPPSVKQEIKTAQASASEAPIATLRELPAQIQREIPALIIGGYLYSSNKADRSILIDKRLVREGEEVAPGLTLEKMMPNGMVLNYKGYRYRSSY